MTAKSNRESMPKVAEIVDLFREHFGAVKVTYACDHTTMRTAGIYEEPTGPRNQESPWVVAKPLDSFARRPPDDR